MADYLLALIILCVSGCSAELLDFRWSESSCPPPSASLLTSDMVPTWGVKNRALYTIPPEVELTMSSIPNANLGIVAITFLPRFTWLGIYEGDVVFDKNDISDYAWIVYRGGKISHYVDGGNLERSNWLRWINCPRHSHEENVWMTSCGGLVYYLTSRDVQPGEELLIYYGDKYAVYLGLSVTAYYDKNSIVATCGGNKLCCKDQIITRTNITSS